MIGTIIRGHICVLKGHDVTEWAEVHFELKIFLIQAPRRILDNPLIIAVPNLLLSSVWTTKRVVTSFFKKECKIH